MDLQFSGEGPNSGLKSLFVRVMGCDFKCKWCDSKFAWQKNENTKLYTDIDLAAELITKCQATHTSHIILTGGNPCLYDFEKVIDILHQHKITIDIETQGSILPKWLNKLDLVVISPKAPSSNQPNVYENINKWLNTKAIVPVALKIPVFNNEDFEFAKLYYDFVKQYNVKLYINIGNTNTEEQGDISRRVLDDYKALIEKVCASELSNVYIMPQIHTLVWNNKQGV